MIILNILDGGDHAGEGDAVTRTAEGGDNTICLNWGSTLTNSDSSANNSFRGTFGALTQANGMITESFSSGNNGFNVSDAVVGVANTEGSTAFNIVVNKNTT